MHMSAVPAFAREHSPSPSLPSPSPTGAFWTRGVERLRSELGCGPDGLGSAEAARRLECYGPNSDAGAQAHSTLRAVLRRLFEPLALILLAAGLVSVATGDIVGGAIIVTILGLSVGLDTVQEGHATRAAEALRHAVALKAEVRRDGGFITVPVEQVVPGDILRVRAGEVVPADSLVVESTAFTAAEAALTGEPYPVEKRPGLVTSAEPAEASNALFRGAVALTGEAAALVVATGPATMFGAAALALAEAQAPSPFQRDLHAFGQVVARLTIGLVVAVLAVRVVLGRPVLDSLLFAVALAVGLTPELLPMVTTVTLSRGALRMAARKVIVKRLAAIHDLGAMTVLCIDKTGTLTSAEIALTRSLDPAGQENARPARLAAVAAALGGDRGSLDVALANAHPNVGQGWVLFGRRAFDYGRRIGSVLAQGPDGTLLILKGAPEAVLALCNARRAGEQTKPMDQAAHDEALGQVRTLSEEGLRSIAVASCPWAGPLRMPGDSDEALFVLEGFCVFADPPKPSAAAAIARLARAGVRLKILSGDDPVVVRRLAGLVGLCAGTVLSGPEIAALNDAALAVRVRKVDAFGRLTPDQKARVVRALQARGTVVGFLGDGINDAPGLAQADVGLSVEGATGVAQAAADMILLASDLAVVADGVEEGRRTFTNILKYVRMGASSNFGNMLSMAVASVALPFLPMLPTQVLLNNMLYDFSEVGIPFDRVAPSAIAQPQVWDMATVLRFAAVMGPLSSLFDLLTFGVLLLVFGASIEEFRAAWFLESMATQILVIFVIRTNGRPWEDRPSAALAASTLAALAAALALPFSPMGSWFGFQIPDLPILLAVGLITVAYLAAVEAVKPLVVRPRRRAQNPRPGA